VVEKSWNPKSAERGPQDPPVDAETLRKLDGMGMGIYVNMAGYSIPLPKRELNEQLHRDAFRERIVNIAYGSEVKDAGPILVLEKELCVAFEKKFKDDPEGVKEDFENTVSYFRDGIDDLARSIMPTPGSKGVITDFDQVVKGAAWSALSVEVENMSRSFGEKYKLLIEDAKKNLETSEGWGIGDAFTGHWKRCWSLSFEISHAALSMNEKARDAGIVEKLFPDSTG